MAVDREGNRCSRDLSKVLNELSQLFEIVPRDQHAFLEIIHNGEEIIFPKKSSP